MANVRGETDPQMVVASSREEVIRLGSLGEDPNVIYAGPIRVRPGGLSVSHDHPRSPELLEI